MAGWGKEPWEAFTLRLLRGSERPSGCSLQTLHAFSTLPFLQMGDEGAPTALHPGLTLGERRAYVPERILLSPFITQVNYFLHEGGDPHGMQPSYLLRSLKSLCQTELSQHIIVISFILMEIGHYHVYNWSADQTHQRHESMHLWALDLITRGSICYYSKLVFT